MTDLQTLRTLLEAGQTVEAQVFCQTLFPAVSRTFAINVSRLPKQLRLQILVSYLLCRIADTIEDDAQLPSGKKAQLLEQFTTLLVNKDWQKEIASFREECQVFDKRENEVLLLQNTHYVLECFARFPEETRLHIAKWVTELALGMKKYALRKPDNSQEVTILTTIEDLEQYCYYVAGTVGHLLTGLFHRYYTCISPSCYERLEAKASSFGIGLQLTNIIKDSVIDYQRGWCYLPGELLERYHLTKDAFVDPNRREEAQEFMAALIATAKRHLDDAMSYTCLLPKRTWKARIFCFLPLFMAIKTLAKALYNEQLFDVQNPVKIARQEVYQIIRYTYCYWWSDHAMQKWYAHACALLEHKKDLRPQAVKQLAS